MQDGDRLRLGDYEVLVSIDERNDFPTDASGQLPVPPRVSARKAAPAIEDLGEELDITDLLSESIIKPHDAAALPKSISDTFELSDALEFVPPTASPPPAKPTRSGFSSLLDSPPDEGNQRTMTQGRSSDTKPKAKPEAKLPDPKSDEWQMQTRPYDRKTLAALTPAALARPEKAEPEARPKRAPEPAAEPSSGIEAFCRGAGIDAASLPADTQAQLLTLAGQMVREVVLGLMEALKGRADMKSRLRLSQTTIQPGENNPLKFSASVDEAVVKLLDPHSSRYLGPIEAIRDSFADLRMHQAALATAIQAATDELMNRLEPGELQERFDRGLKRGALLGAANKMKYWDLYIEFYQALNQRNEQGLPTLFAEELARTYAEKAAQKKK
jgi:type VI secretion system protein